jgi:hypothetical protein
MTTVIEINQILSPAVTPMRDAQLGGGDVMAGGILRLPLSLTAFHGNPPYFLQ